ncbi:MAG: FAD-dependent oxidoreductase, partial [Prosthecobacter sp.]|nr:FAD-dependent oxidoreductase [Prosthecobacter sp.]
MRVPTCFLALLSAASLNAEANAAAAREFDVVIYGGTCAAVTAAVQVRQMGKSVIIVSPDKHLGGLSAGG